jgi:ParB-like chromosome segregation protein Spo0J
MATSNEIKYAKLDEFILDPKNPRLGRSNTRVTLAQSKILSIMKGWALEELAVSFLENGFWPQEPLIVTKEVVYGRSSLVVIEGNRRLAALKLLQLACKKQANDPKWAELVSEFKPSASLFSKIPYIEVSSRADLEAFLGFRHVTGIKEWKPAEKAEYISKLIDEGGYTYEEVMRKIGSKTPSVRQNYISYKLLLQMEDEEDISVGKVETKFSVLFLSLRTEGVQKYLHIDIKANPRKAQRPVPRSHLKNLANFARWLFGTDSQEAVVTDSRQVDQFGKILENPKAVAYLERTKQPSFEFAYQIAGGDEPELISLLDQASDNVEVALGRAHLYVKSKQLRLSVERLARHATQLTSLFPGLAEKIESEAE